MRMTWTWKASTRLPWTLRSDSAPDSDRKNQATSSQKSESPPRDAPDSPQRDEAMPAATVSDGHVARPAADAGTLPPTTGRAAPTSGGTSSRRKHQPQTTTGLRAAASKAVHSRIQKNMSTSESESEADDHRPTRSGSCPPRTNVDWSGNAREQRRLGEDRPPDRGARRHVGSGGCWGFQAVQVVGPPGCGGIYSLLGIEKRASRAGTMRFSFQNCVDRSTSAAETRSNREYNTFGLRAVPCRWPSAAILNDRFAHGCGRRGRRRAERLWTMHLQQFAKFGTGPSRRGPRRARGHGSRSRRALVALIGLKGRLRRRRAIFFFGARRRWCLI